MIVLDASVAVKIYREEESSEAARSVIAHNQGRISAPDLLAIELAGVIVRDANIDKSAAETQRLKLRHLAVFLHSPVITMIRSDPPTITAAAELAIELGHPLKDCIYLALATKLGCPLVTADARFVARARSAWTNVVMLGE